MSGPGTARCLLQGCNQRVMADSAYCSMVHSNDAVKLGQADACVSCRIYAKTPGFSTCSKLCGGLLSLQNRMGGRGRGQDQAPPAPLVPPAPTNPSPIKNANKDEKNRAGNDFAYPCGCIIRILKMGPWGLVPNTCPMCSPPITKEPGAQTDSIDEFKATASVAAKTDQHPDSETAVNEADEPKNVSVYFG